MIALVVGTLLAVASLAFVLFPLFADARTAARRAALRPPDRVREPSPSERAIMALREIEFDRVTDKLSERDYAELKAAYTREAVQAMRAEEPASAVADAELEATIRRYRALGPACPSCGPRPEADAIFCSECGRYLAGSCSGCGAPVTEPGARFCAECGKSLAA